MAKDKKSFVMYADFINAFEILDDAEAGRLIKHVLRYVNDKNPVAPDRITEISFEPIKQQLKRDLVKWEGKSGVRSEIGKLGGLKSAEKRAKNKESKQIEPIASKTQAKQPVNVTVNVTDNANVTEKVFLRLREQIIPGKVSDFFKENFPSYLNQWQMKNQTLSAEIVLQKMDAEYIQYTFNNENHLKNSFKSCHEKILKQKNLGSKNKFTETPQDERKYTLD